MVRKILDAIQDSTLGSAEKLHDIVMIRLLKTSEKFVEDRKYNDIIAEAIDNNREEVTDWLIESVQDERVDGLIDDIALGVIKDLKKQIREEDQLK